MYTYRSNDMARKRKRKSVDVPDIFNALEEMNFEFIEELKKCHAAIINEDKSKKEKAENERKRRKLEENNNNDSEEAKESDKSNIPL